ncbi:MAG: hypothetical protein RLZZ262_1913 [Bacteroidota bacterium]|jgi:hypothetical protein
MAVPKCEFTIFALESYLKSLHFISPLLLFFVVFTTRIDIPLLQAFSDRPDSDLVKLELTENKTDEKSEEDCKEDDFKEYSNLCNKVLSKEINRSGVNGGTWCNWFLSPDLSFESPPPKV